MAHISRPEPDFVADYNQNDFKEEKKEATGKKKTVTFDQNENNKKEVDDKKFKEKESHVTDQFLKNLEMLEMKSMDDLWICDLIQSIIFEPEANYCT